MKRPLTKPESVSLGSVRSDELLPMAEFGRRMGLKKRALQSAQKRGLRTALFAGRKYVLGSDALDFFRRLASGNGEGES